MKENKPQQNKSPKKRKKKQEQLSTKDIQELMGMNMQVYTRKEWSDQKEMITFICGYAVGQLLTVLLLYMGYNWYESRNED
jgi:uncharacterized metal-binding protein